MCYLATVDEWLSNYNHERFLGHHYTEWITGAVIILVALVLIWFLQELWKRDHKVFWVVLSILLSVLTGGLLPILLLPFDVLWLCVRIIRHAWKG
jgi:hypothetical protein